MYSYCNTCLKTQSHLLVQEGHSCSICKRLKHYRKLTTSRGSVTSPQASDTSPVSFEDEGVTLKG